MCEKICDLNKKNEQKVTQIIRQYQKQTKQTVKPFEANLMTLIFQMENISGTGKWQKKPIY